MISKGNFRSYKFLGKVVEGFVSDIGIETAAQSQKISPRRPVDKGHYTYRIPARSTKQIGMSQHVCNVCTDKRKHHTRKSTKKLVYCPKCDGSLRLGECFDVHHLGVNY
jgi:hypothetical protein